LDPLYETSTLQSIEHIFAGLPPDCIKEGGWEHISRRVVLMNYTTKLTSNTTIAREVLHTNIKNSKLDDIVSHYDPDVYPGVKICIGKNNWTAKVFRTGKIILTGVVSPTECSDLILRLLSLFETVLPQKLKLS
jgi:hypothetical protein